MQDQFSKLESKIGVVFNNRDLFIQAFTHRSYINEHSEISAGHNERLEFLGDAVIELIVTEYLYEIYPEKPEGELTNYRAALVNTDMLSEVASELDLNSCLRLSRGEAKDIGKARQYILADVFESLTGAIYLDQGFNSAKDFLSKYLFPKVDKIMKNKLWKDPKSSFQEEAQERLGITPTYRVIEERGPDHAKTFVMGVYLNSDLIATGEGMSKQEAEIQAAEMGLKKKSWK